MKFLTGGRKSPVKTFIYQTQLFYMTYKLIQTSSTLSKALLVAKYFIYKGNLNEQTLLFPLFKTQLRENIMTERYIVIKNKIAKLFNDKENLPPPTSQ